MLRLVSFAFFAWLCALAPSRAEEAVCPPTELWVANTRSGGCEEPPTFSRCSEGDGWKKSSLKRWKAVAADRPICVWIHGNDNTDADARQQGRYLMNRLAPYAPPEGLRVLVWSWPAAKTDAGPLEDLRIKAARSDAEAKKLAKFLADWQPQGRVSFAGYSFGARIITGALDDLAEHERDTPQVTTMSANLSAVLLAPALHNYWLLPGNRHGQAISEVDAMLIMKNPIDRALKWYPIMSYGRLRSGPQALGYTGLPGLGRLGEDAAKVEHYNVSGIVGREHDAMLYLSSSCIIERMAPYVFAPTSAPTELAERETSASADLATHATN